MEVVLLEMAKELWESNEMKLLKKIQIFKLICKNLLLIYKLAHPVPTISEYFYCKISYRPPMLVCFLLCPFPLLYSQTKGTSP